MVPKIGRIVLYKLSQHDISLIRQKRAAHVEPISCNNHSEGDVVPAMIVRVWGNEETSVVNLKVMLDGEDHYWASSVENGEKVGQFEWPEISRA